MVLAFEAHRAVSSSKTPNIQERNVNLSRQLKNLIGLLHYNFYIASFEHS